MGGYEGGIQSPQTHMRLVHNARLERISLTSSGEASGDWSYVICLFELPVVKWAVREKKMLHTHGYRPFWWRLFFLSSWGDSRFVSRCLKLFFTSCRRRGAAGDN